jgi:hypothetical protein
MTEALICANAYEALSNNTPLAMRLRIQHCKRTGQMAVYLFVATKAHDLSWVDEYQANVPAIMAIMRKHGGEYFAVFRKYQALRG